MNKRTLLAFIITLLFTVSLLYGGLLIIFKIKENNDKAKHLNEIIETNKRIEGQKVYLNITSISNKFANTNKNGYYFVTDGKYSYVVYLSDKKANELFEKDLENNPERIYGVAKNTSNDLKEIAINSYNYGKEDKISSKDYNSYFGALYLKETN